MNVAPAEVCEARLWEDGLAQLGEDFVLVLGCSALGVDFRI